ncbi:MAG: hypothetical protein MUE61_10590 [Vicinamibacterales bacterium]|jgi:hypothetical protein|nr:hypothetical protein [Vicinamibacterales bacterium]
MWQVVQKVFAQAWQQFTTQSLALLPNVLVGLLFLAIGTALALLAGRVAKFLLRRSAVERRANKIGLSSWLERAGVLSATAVLVRLVQVAFAIITAALVMYSLDAALASDLTRRFFLYLPNLVVGITIFFVGILTARVVSRSVLIGAVNRGLPAARLLATLARVGIILLSSAVALEHVGIGRAIVPSAMLILLAGVTFALALAVGLGSRDLVARWIEDQISPPTPAEADQIQHW